MRLLIVFIILVSCAAKADEIKVAVASNFLPTALLIGDQFELDTGYDVTLISASTGKLYAQIIHGAPFDVFLAADRMRPEKLENVGIGDGSSRFTYAVGRLVFWAPDLSSKKCNLEQVELIVARCLQQTSNQKRKRIALANPKLAPYGIAAQQLLNNELKQLASSTTIVHADNINQAFQFVQTGHAQYGLIAYSQALSLPNSQWWLIPNDWHQAIEQQAIAITESKQVTLFMQYLRSDGVQKMIKAAGYN